jgi:hypothetical protein
MNIIGESVSTSFSVQCRNCDFTGTLTTEAMKAPTLNVGGVINFSEAVCPKCKNESIFAPSGCYVRQDNGYMVRTGDAKLSS